MIATRITVYNYGNVLIENTNDLGEFVSSENHTISASDFQEVAGVFYENRFFDLTDNLDTDSCDGSWHYLEVTTENNSYKKGGLNPGEKRFVNCYKVVERTIQSKKQ